MYHHIEFLSIYEVLLSLFSFCWLGSSGAGFYPGAVHTLSPGYNAAIYIVIHKAISKDVKNAQIIAIGILGRLG